MVLFEEMQAQQELHSPLLFLWQLTQLPAGSELPSLTQTPFGACVALVSKRRGKNAA